MIEIADPSSSNHPARWPESSRVEAGSMTAQAKRLRFDDLGVEAEFQADYFAGAISGIRINMILGVVVFALWALVDLLVMPQAVEFSWPIRFGVVCPVLFLVFLLSYSPRFERLMNLSMMLVDLITACVMISIIVVAGEDGHRYYYAGVILSVIGCCASPGLLFRPALAVTLIIALSYELTLWSQATPRVALNNSMLLATAEVLAISVSYTLESQRRADFLQRWVIRKQSEALREALEEVDRTSRTDTLTGLFNRRHFFDEAAGGGRGRVSVIILDVDHFKAINDQFGHAAGDVVLRDLARRVRLAVRPGDVACRYGGEEFAVLLRDADLATASHVGERLRRDVEAAPFQAGATLLDVTISVGVASILEDEAAAIEALIDRADQALYEAKNAGRNRVRLWHPDYSRVETA